MSTLFIALTDLQRNSQDMTCHFAQHSLCRGKRILSVFRPVLGGDWRYPVYHLGGGNHIARTNVDGTA